MILYIWLGYPIFRIRNIGMSGSDHRYSDWIPQVWKQESSHLLPLIEAWFTGAKSGNSWVSIIPWLHSLVVSKPDEGSKATNPSRRAASHECHFHPGVILTKSVYRILHSTSGVLHPCLQWEIWCLGGSKGTRHWRTYWWICGSLKDFVIKQSVLFDSSDNDIQSSDRNKKPPVS